MDYDYLLAGNRRGSRLQGLAVTIIPDHSCWVNLPPDAYNELVGTGQQGLPPLPLVLALRSSEGSSSGGLGNRTAWVAWSGGMSRAQGIIEVPSGFAACLGLQRGMRVNLALPPPSGPGAVVEAESVVVEPVSWSDWEVLELNAGHLEEVIMNQVGVLARGQPFCVWARQQSLIRLRPTECRPADVVRLVPGCELHVAPKPRLAPQQQPAAGASQGQGGSVVVGPGKTAPKDFAGPGPTANGDAATAAVAAPALAAEAALAWGPQLGPVLLRVLPLPAQLQVQLGAGAPGSSSEAVQGSSWLTTAVLVHPSVCGLSGSSKDGAACAPRAGLRPGSWVQAKAGSAGGADAGASGLLHPPLAVLPCSLCPPGHAMVASPVLAALQLLPHMKLELEPMGDSTYTLGSAAAAAQLAKAAAGAAGRGGGQWQGASGPSAPPQLLLHPLAWDGSSGSQAAPGAAGVLQTHMPLQALGLQAWSMPAAGMQQGSEQQALHAALCVWWSSQACAMRSLLGACATAGLLTAQEAEAAAADCAAQVPSGVLLHLSPNGSNDQYANSCSSTHGHCKGPSKGLALSAGACLSVVVRDPAAASRGKAVLRSTPCLDSSLLTLPQAGTANPEQASAGTSSQPLQANGHSSPTPQVHVQIAQAISFSMQPAYPTTSLPTGAVDKATAEESASLVACLGSKIAAQHVEAAVQSVAWLKPHLTDALKRLCSCLVLNGGTNSDATALSAPAALISSTAPVAVGGQSPQAVPAVGVGHLMVTGPPGSGKSALLRAAACVLGAHPGYTAHVVHVRCSELAAAGLKAARQGLEAAFGEALACAPSLLLFDDLEMLTPSSQSGGPESDASSSEALESSQLAEALADTLASLRPSGSAASSAAAGGPAGAGRVSGPAAGCAGACVAAAAAVRDASALHPTLRQAGLFDCEVRLPAPGTAGRAALMAAAPHIPKGVAFEADHIGELASKAEGCEAGDLGVLMDRAAHAALARALRGGASTAVTAAAVGAGALPALSSLDAAASSCSQSLSVKQEDVAAAMSGYTPPAFWQMGGGQKGAGAASADADGGWQDVGGLQEARAALTEALALPFRYRGLVAGAPLRLRTGLLLYGPPGCGKTHVVGAAVAALAAELNMRFISVKGPELLNKYIGQSEASVRELFARAAAAAPCALFFDEFDAIAPPRGHDSTGVTDRVVNQLLTELDGVEGLRGVAVLAATSRPDLVDAALLRPGRLDRLVYCGVPDVAERREILAALGRKLALTLDADFGAIAQQTEGLTGADLGAILSEAQLLAVHDALAAAQAAGDAGHAQAAPMPVVNMDHLRQAAKQVRPSLPMAERRRLEGLYARFRAARAPTPTSGTAAAPPANTASVGGHAHGSAPASALGPGPGPSQGTGASEGPGAGGGSGGPSVAGHAPGSGSGVSGSTAHGHQPSHPGAAGSQEASHPVQAGSSGLAPGAGASSVDGITGAGPAASRADGAGGSAAGGSGGSISILGRGQASGSHADHGGGKEGRAGASGSGVVGGNGPALAGSQMHAAAESGRQMGADAGEAGPGAEGAAEEEQETGHASPAEIDESAVCFAPPPSHYLRTLSERSALQQNKVDKGKVSAEANGGRAQGAGAQQGPAMEAVLGGQASGLPAVSGVAGDARQNALWQAACGEGDASAQQELQQEPGAGAGGEEGGSAVGMAAQLGEPAGMRLGGDGAGGGLGAPPGSARKRATLA